VPQPSTLNPKPKTAQGLEELPLAVLDQHEVQTLILRRNNLSTLPPEIVSLKNLKTLDLAYNSFQELPEALLLIHGLTDVKITGNPLPSVPKDILSQGSMHVIESMRRVRASRVSKRLDMAKLGIKT
jgi:Leucine-rich repeat (LRR) protein